MEVPSLQNAPLQRRVSWTTLQGVTFSLHARWCWHVHALYGHSGHGLRVSIHMHTYVRVSTGVGVGVDMQLPGVGVGAPGVTGSWCGDGSRVYVCVSA